ncbi:MAG: hypothetical protein V5A24_04085 [Haloarculaceae archaeon]
MVRLPTRAGDWRLLGRTLRLVLGIPRYALLGVLMTGVAISLIAFSQNLSLVSFALQGSLALGDRFDVLLGLYPFLGTSFTVLTSVVLLLVAILVGADIALVVYHLREHELRAAESSGSVAGVFLGVLGAGCAACGSAILVGVLSLFGAAGLVTALPLEGLEFALLAVLVLLLSLYWLADGMRGGSIRGCPIDPP